MRNLYFSTEEETKLNFSFPGETADSTQILFERDSDSERLFVACTPELLCFNDADLIWFIPLLSIPCQLHFCVDLESLFVGYFNGQLSLVDNERVTQIVGHVDENIIALEWSPTEASIVIITTCGRLVLFQTDGWERIAEISLDSRLRELEIDTRNCTACASWHGDGRNAAIYIGSPQGHYIALHNGATLDVETAVEMQSGLSGILAWQPNGRHLYAVGDHSDNSQCIHLFENNGLSHGSFDLCSTAGNVSAVCWSHDSQFLTVAYTSPESYLVQIWRRSNWHWYMKYEKRWDVEGGRGNVEWDAVEVLRMHVYLENMASLYHFTLNFVMDTTVSANGTAAVIDGSKLCLTPFRYLTMPPPLYATHISFSESIQHVAFSGFGSKERVAALLASGIVELAECPTDIDRWHEACDVEEDEDSQSGVGVWTASRVSVKEKLASPGQVVWLSDERIAVFGIGRHPTRPSTMVIGILITENGKTSLCWSDVIRLEFKLLTVVGTSSNATNVYTTDTDVYWCVEFIDRGLYMQSLEGEIYSSPLDNLSSIHKDERHSLPVPCPHVLLGCVEERDVLIGLTSSGHLYRGTIRIMEKVTSLAKHVNDLGQEFLLLTTKDDQLHIMQFSSLEIEEKPVDDVIKCVADREKSLADDRTKSFPKLSKRTGATAGMHTAMMPIQTQSQMTSFLCRPIEQGARIITSPPGFEKPNKTGRGVDVIFQMPRGNLETASLRLFVLQKIVAALNENAFRRAWELAVEHRVDLNILVDYQWPKFLSYTESFVTAIASSDSVCELLTALQPGSLLETGSAYCACLPDAKSPEKAVEIDDGKVTTICEALRTAMCKIDRDLYCKAIVFSHARSDPPDLENALRCVKAARIKEIESSEDDGSISLSGDSLRNLMLYVDVSELYAVALALYDLSLAYMVVTHAQRDPGEYLAELERLSRLEPPSYRKAHIDRQLHRHSQSLRHLVEAGPEHLDEAMDIAAEHGLFHELLFSMDQSHDRRNEVLSAYGHWLRAKGMQEDAGAAFMAGGEFKLALDAYQSCGEWQMVLILGKRLRLAEGEIQEIATEMVEDLKSMERLGDAADLCKEILEDHEETVTLLTAARRWKEALIHCHRAGRENLIESVVIPGAAAATQYFIEDFTSRTENVKKYTIRLKEVEKKRQQMEAAVGATGMTGGEVDGASTLGGLSIYTDRTHLWQSTAGSTAALTTGGRKPNKSSKKAKKLKIKAGSPEEEATLRSHLEQMKPADNVLLEVSSLCEFLISSQFMDDAQKLHTALDTLIKTYQSEFAAASPQEIQVRWKWDVLRHS